MVNKARYYKNPDKPTWINQILTKFWKEVKPLLSNNIISNDKITALEGDKIIKSDKETAIKKVLNVFFSNIVTSLSIPQFDQIDVTSEKKL